MIPIAPVVSIVIVILRIVASQAGKGTALPQRRRKIDPRLLNVALRLLLLCVGFPIVLGLSAGVVAAGVPWAMILLLGAFAAYSLPALTLGWVLIPLKLTRTSYWFAYVSPPLAHSADRHGGAVLAGVLALGRHKVVDVAMLGWLSRRLERQPSLRALSMTAAGLLAFAGGEREVTRAILRAVEGIEPRANGKARRVAREWLVADAASRADWAEVRAIGAKENPLRGGFWPYLMSLVASRLLEEEGAPRNGKLGLFWLLSSHRIATLPLVRRAFALPTREEPTELAVPSGIPAGDALLGRALAAHADVLTNPSGAALESAGLAWDAVRKAPAVSSLVARRALALEAQVSADTALARVLSSAETDLAPFAARFGGQVAAESETLEGASRQAEARELEDIESLAEALTRRTNEKRELPMPSEWMEWGALRRACDRATSRTSAARHRAVFEAVHAPACNYAVWLFNKRDEKLLANAIFRWLLDHARIVGHTAASETLANNVKLGTG
jgi:hypothetical protein